MACIAIARSFSGWVVGPLPDRSIFDKKLPTTWDAITSIDLNTVSSIPFCHSGLNLWLHHSRGCVVTFVPQGHSPVDPSYENVTRHKKWAIPW